MISASVEEALLLFMKWKTDSATVGLLMMPFGDPLALQEQFVLVHITGSITAFTESSFLLTSRNGGSFLSMRLPGCKFFYVADDDELVKHMSEFITQPAEEMLSIVHPRGLQAILFSVGG